MGIDNLKVQLVVGAFILPLCAASLCRVGHEYWSSDTQSCMDCSRCEGTRLVIRPCQGHLNTVCGSLSDLNIDWSWLTNRPNKQADERHKKDHKIHFIDDEIYEKKEEGLYHGFDKSRLHLISEDDLINADENLKHLGPMTTDIFDPESKHRKSHDKPLASELFIADKSDLKENDLKSKSISDFGDEKAWEERLIQSKNRLEHRKEDLIKTLHKGHKKVKLNHPSFDSDIDAIYFDGPINKHVGHHKKQNKNNEHKSRSHISKQDLEIFQDLVNQERNRDDILNLLEDKHISHKTHHSEKKKRKYSKPGYPTYAFDYRSLVPKHRMFLGEPSTVSEIMGQDIETDDEQIVEEEGKHDMHSSRLKLFPWEKLSGEEEVDEPSVVAIPFTTAERFIWDWQAVALASAVIACLLFFTVTALYSILHARQERRLKNQFDTDVEKLSARRGLLQPHSREASGADSTNANQYLEKLLAGKKSGENEENVYTEEKQPTS